MNGNIQIIDTSIQDYVGGVCSPSQVVDGKGYIINDGWLQGASGH
jgi:hypothetical protein